MTEDPADFYTPVVLTAEQIARVTALLPVQPSPYTKKAKAAHVDAIVLAMFEMDQETYQLSLQHLFNTAPITYDMVYALLSEKANDGSSESA